MRDSEAAVGFCVGGLCVDGPPVDCLVSEWAVWRLAPDQQSATRVRTVVAAASNGGADCPALYEAVTCSESPSTCQSAGWFFDERESSSLGMLEL